MQYDNPLWASQFKDALAANTGISSPTAAAINSLLGLDTAESIVVGGWDGEAVSVPEGKTAQAVFADIAGEAGESVSLNVPEELRSAQTFVFNSDADLSVTFGSSPVARATSEFPAVERVIVGGNGDDTITVFGDKNTTLEGGAGNDTLTTTGGDDLVIGGTGDNNINTGAGNDTVVLSGGNDIVDAGAGRDIVQFASPRSEFTATAGAGDVQVTGTIGTASIKNAEFLTFADNHTVAIADSEAEAVALRLYQGLLGRDVDNGGGESVTNAVEAGVSTTAIVQDFLSSGEYQSATNLELVQNLYTSLLGREADSDGQSGWLNYLAAGASRVDVATGIGGSAEASAKLNDADFISKLYNVALGRDADSDGLAGWQALLTAGGNRAEVTQGIVGSAEAATKFDADFIDSLYENALGRDADADGKAGWMDALANHSFTQADVVIGIAGSAEAADHISNVVLINGAV